MNSVVRETAVRETETRRWQGWFAWGRRILQRWRGDAATHRLAMPHRVPATAYSRSPGTTTWVQEEPIGVIGDCVEFIGGPLDGLKHMLWNCCAMAPRMAVPISGEIFEAVENTVPHEPPSWPTPSDGVTSIAVYALYPSSSGWRYHYESSGAAG